MKDRIFYTDVNLFGPNELKFDMECGSTFFVGNIIDLKHCCPEDLEAATTKQQEVLEYAGLRYISGDRELTTDRLYHRTDDNILVTYGDDIAGKERSTKRPLITLLDDCISSISHVSLCDNMIKKLSEKAYSYNCHTIVTGYFHPSELIDIEYNGIRIIVLPKGRSVVSI